MSDTFTFWPKDIVSDLPVSPLVILKEAATELGRVTQGVVEAEVELDKVSSTMLSTGLRTKANCDQSL